MERERMLVRILREICAEEGLGFRALAGGWILEVTAEGKKGEDVGKARLLVHGNRFPNNSASVDAVCSDKSALSELLAVHGIPHVEHWYCPAPEEWRFSAADGTGIWPGIQKRFDQYHKLVVKDNAGTGGRWVYRVSSQRKLEEAVFGLFLAGKAAALSPWYEIAHEYRAVWAGGRVQLLYEKIRPAGQWKHNLGQGATAVPVTDPGTEKALEALTLTCARLLPLSFASVDLVEVEGELRVLEINTGVMMEEFAAAAPDHYEKAKAIYRTAVLDYFRQLH